jgi:outer membrane protein assembly factor BamB
MHAESTQTLSQAPAEHGRPSLAASLRLGPAAVVVALYWALYVVVARLELPYFYRFLYNMAAPASLVLFFLIWWWASRRVRLRERLAGFLLVVGGAAVATLLCHPSVGVFGLFMSGLPIVLTAWTVWMLVARKTAFAWDRLASVAVVLLAWVPLLLVRIDGLNADLVADLRWRWSPSAEDLFLAEKADPAAAPTVAPSAWAPTLTPGDWTAFRGPNRDGVIRGTTIATDWNANRPRLLWRQRVGPAWSSVIVVGGRVFTQEQRGDQEAVVGYDGATGQPIWVHEDAARFSENVSGIGPRGTPTFADGRIFALGATGLLNCLDAATGQRHWSRDVTADTGAKAPLWGFSSSPLVVDGLVVVFGAGEPTKSLHAYRVATGELAWTAAGGDQGGYASPQLTTVAGKPQILFLGDHGLIGVEPATGAVLWQHGWVMAGAPRTGQPHAVGDTQLAVATLAGPGMALIDVRPDGQAWKVEERWATTDLKPEFPDLVVHQGHAYGFDGSIFCCLDLATGKRCWKGGRYGRGQVMLLADQSLLLVLSEKGEAVLLAANSERPQELGRFPALDGKTWNHPVIAHGRLYVRNAEEMACYDLVGERPKGTAPNSDRN